MTALGSLGIGTLVVTRAGPAVVVHSLVRHHSAAGVAVYNIEVESDHTYFVGSNGEWVHNDCGSVLEELFRNPSQLAGKGLEDIKSLIGKIDDPWEEGALTKGSQKGNGWTLREGNGKGGFTDRYLQWHPGGGHHGLDPYWKISSGRIGTLRF
jgi:hypothetical protein